MKTGNIRCSAPCPAVGSLITQTKINAVALLPRAGIPCQPAENSIPGAWGELIPDSGSAQHPRTHREIGNPRRVHPTGEIPPGIQPRSHSPEPERGTHSFFSEGFLRKEPRKPLGACGTQAMFPMPGSLRDRCGIAPGSLPAAPFRPPGLEWVWAEPKPRSCPSLPPRGLGGASQVPVPWEFTREPQTRPAFPTHRRDGAGAADKSIPERFPKWNSAAARAEIRMQRDKVGGCCLSINKNLRGCAGGRVPKAALGAAVPTGVRDGKINGHREKNIERGTPITIWE